MMPTNVTSVTILTKRTNVAKRLFAISINLEENEIIIIHFYIYLVSKEFTFHDFPGSQIDQTIFQKLL